MRMAVGAGLIFVALVIQSTIAPLFSVKGVRPDLLLALVTSYGLLRGREQGVGVGFCAGLVQDLSSGNIFGLNTLSKMLTGYLFGLAERKVFKEHFLLPLAGVLAATIISSVFGVLFWLAIGYSVQLPTYTTSVLLPQALYNMAAAVPIHHIVLRFTKRETV